MKHERELAVWLVPAVKNLSLLQNSSPHVQIDFSLAQMCSKHHESQQAQNPHPASTHHRGHLSHFKCLSTQEAAGCILRAGAVLEKYS